MLEFIFFLKLLYNHQWGVWLIDPSHPSLDSRLMRVANMTDLDAVGSMIDCR